MVTAMSRDIKPTAEQARAISARGDALLISAGAGAGKTRVLTERLISHLTDAENPCDVSEFLVVTFTRASAEELRTRIRDAIADELAENHGNRHLRRQSLLLHGSQIGTIHSFCTTILRENAHLIGIAPDFRVAEDDEMSVLRTSVLERLIDERYEAIETFSGFEELVDSLARGRDDRTLAALVLDLYGKLRSHDDERGWLSEVLRQLRLDDCADIMETMWGAFLAEGALTDAAYWLDCLNDGLAAIEFADNEKLTAKYFPCYSAAASGLEALLASRERGWDALHDAVAIGFPRVGSHRATDAELKATWGAASAFIKTLPSVFYAKADEIIADMRSVVAVVAALFELTTDFSAAFTEEKKRRRIVDFSDLEHYALDVLVDPKTKEPTSVAREISLRYKEIMVDEYQDVSEIQERIFNAVSRDGRNLVTVGDMRQSIYRFRLADPSIFREKYNSYGDERLVRLTKNFRSRGAMLDAVNFVFSNVMSVEVGEMEYTPKEYLSVGNEDAEGGERMEIDLLQTQTDEDDAIDIKDARPNKHELEGKHIANRIRELMRSSGEDGKPYEYKDFAIILRVKSPAGTYRKILQSAGIPVVSPHSESYFDTAEVGLALAFLQVIDNPRQDTPLAAVLRSGVYGFTADELAHVALLCSAQHFEGEFYVALQAFATTSEKAARFLADLEKYRELAPEYGAERMLWHIFNSTELPALSVSMTNGETRRENLMRLTRDARRAAAAGYVSVAEFLRYVERARANDTRNADEAGAENAVQIMSIHKSKGLEFRVVFYADAVHEFNKTDEGDALMFHRDLGVGIKRVDRERRIAYSTLPRLAIKKKLNDEMLSEALRMLYVVLTRAHERVIVTYAETNPLKTLESLAAETASPVAPFTVAKQSNLGRVLLLAALAPGGEQFIGINVVKPPQIEARFTASELAERPAELATQDDVPRAEPTFEPLSYAHAAAVDLPSKLTVTEVKNRASDAEIADEAEANHRRTRRDYAFARPRFIVGESTATLTAAERGTALHLALQRLELRRYADEDDVRAAVAALCERGLMTSAQADVVDAVRLLAFFDSELAARAIAAQRADEKRVFREFKFSLLVAAERFFEGCGDDKILFQGCVDLAFYEGDELVIVDFKSDRLFGDDAIERKIAEYAPQLEAYAEAMERVTGASVRECAIYFLDKNIAQIVK